MIGGGGGPYTTSASPNVPALRYDPGGGIPCRRMFMENLVMTTTLTIEELDVPVTASAVASFAMCLSCFDPLDLDESPSTTAVGCFGPICV